MANAAPGYDGVCGRGLDICPLDPHPTAISDTRLGPVEALQQETDPDGAMDTSFDSAKHDPRLPDGDAAGSKTDHSDWYEIELTPEQIGATTERVGGFVPAEISVAPPQPPRTTPLMLTLALAAAVHACALAYAMWRAPTEGAGGRFLEAVEVDAIDVEIVAASTASAASEAAPDASVKRPPPTPVQEEVLRADKTAPEPAPVNTPDQTPPETEQVQTAPPPDAEGEIAQPAPQAEVAVVLPEPEMRLQPEPPAVETRPSVTPPDTAAPKASAPSAEAAASAAAPSRSGPSAGEVRRYQTRLRAHIARLVPPGIGRPGTTVVSFALAADGSLRTVTVRRSSGSETLDRRAMSAITRASPFPRPPSGMSPRQLEYEIPFHFR